MKHSTLCCVLLTAGMSLYASDNLQTPLINMRTEQSITNAQQDNANSNRCSRLATSGCYLLTAVGGGFVGFVGSAFAASLATPHKAFPTQQEYLAEQHATYEVWMSYGKIAVPICALVPTLAAFVYYRIYLPRKNAYAQHNTIISLER